MQPPYAQIAQKFPLTTRTSVSCLPCRQKRKVPAPWRGDFWYNTDTHQDRTKAGS